VLFEEETKKVKILDGQAHIDLPHFNGLNDLLKEYFKVINNSQYLVCNPSK